MIKAIVGGVLLMALCFSLPAQVVPAGAGKGPEEFDLAESLVLLSLNDHKGTFLVDTEYLDLALAGVMLVELQERGLIEIEQNCVRTGLSDTAGDPILDEILVKIRTRRRIHSIHYWIERSARLAGKKRLAQLDGLVDRGILEKRQVRSFLGSPKFRYRALDPQREQWLKEQVRATVAVGSQEESDRFLASLVYSCSLHRTVFPDGKEIRSMRRPWRAIVRGNRLYSAIDRVIRERKSWDDMVQYSHLTNLYGTSPIP